MKIAILGTRGIPNRYGGFEAFAENLSQRLVEKGHEVTVYCRRPFTRPEDSKLIDPRIRRVILPTISAKSFDTAFHTLLSAIHVAFARADVVLMCNVANSAVAWIPRLFGIPVALNVDGLDRQRKKWGWFASLYLHLCEIFSTITPTRVVTDAVTIQRYYIERYRKQSTMISYGAAVPNPATVETSGDSMLERFNLKPRQYILYVSRLEPENHPELVIAAYKNVTTDWPLVIVGGSTYDAGYAARLRSEADSRVIFTEAIYGPGYWELQQNAGVFVFACEVGGVHPALIETMAVGNASLYLDTESNRETAGECGLPFQPDAADLAGKMSYLLADSSLREDLGRAASVRARQLYGWDEVTRKYEQLFSELAR